MSPSMLMAEPGWNETWSFFLSYKRGSRRAASLSIGGWWQENRVWKVGVLQAPRSAQGSGAMDPHILLPSSGGLPGVRKEGSLVRRG